MTEQERFTKAVQAIKHTKKISIQNIADELKVPRHIIDNIKRGTNPTEELTQELIKTYPFVSGIFDANSTNVKGVGEEPVAWKEAFFTQKELIEVLKKRIKLLEDENNDLKIELNTLRKLMDDYLKP